MTAAYPTNIKVFPTHVDFTEVIIAKHVNDLQDEVVAIQNTLGTNPQNPPFFSTVKDRITNLESLRHYAGTFSFNLPAPGVADGIFFFPGLTFTKPPSVVLTPAPMHRTTPVIMNVTDVSTGSFHWYAWTRDIVNPGDILICQLWAAEFDTGH